MFDNLQLKDVFWLAPIAAMVIAILPMPYGYYTLSRIIVCAGSAYFAYQFYKKKEVPKTWIFGFFAVLYNPLIPIHLNEKIIWTIINIITIAMFWLNRKKID